MGNSALGHSGLDPVGKLGADRVGAIARGIGGADIERQPGEMVEDAVNAPSPKNHGADSARDELFVLAKGQLIRGANNEIVRPIHWG